MAAEPTINLAYCFGYNHYQTDGKLENIYDSLGSFDELNYICLDLTNGTADDFPLDPTEIEQRAARAKTVIARLRRRHYAVDLIIPGPLTGSATDPAHKTYLKQLATHAVATGARNIWLDDRLVLNTDPTDAMQCTAAACHAFARHARLSVSPKRLGDILTCDTLTTSQQKIKTAWFRFLHRSLLQTCRAACKPIAAQHPPIKLGLIAAPPEYYRPFAVTAAQLAAEIAGPRKALLAQAQSFTSDYHRSAVLDTAQQIAIAQAETQDSPTIGFIHHSSGSCFHKSIEATQMQINLNILHGVRTIMLSPFDQLGAAPGSDNAYLQMHSNSESFWNKLATILPSSCQPIGLTVITPSGSPEQIPPRAAGLAAYCQRDPWPTILARLGFPVCTTPASAIGPDADTTYILTGDTPLSLSAKQLDHVFDHGVLLDVIAAETIQNMNHSNLLGFTVHGPLRDIQAEVLADAAFDPATHGHRSLLKGVMQPTDLRRLQPVHPNTRIISALLRKDDLPNIPGMVLFDNIEKSQRSATLPYSFACAPYDHLLDPRRQLHLHNVLAWLFRRRLPCFVENTPDLVPFYIPTPDRIVLALLNVGFDWAIDSRIRLGRLPFTVKRVRELNDQGKLISDPDLKLHTLSDYQYIELTSDTAVPPMQMTTFILEA